MLPENSEEKLYCPHCGARKEETNGLCPTCGCKICETPQVQKIHKKTSEKTKDRPLYMLNDKRARKLRKIKSRLRKENAKIYQKKEKKLRKIRDKEQRRKARLSRKIARREKWYKKKMEKCAKHIPKELSATPRKRFKVNLRKTPERKRTKLPQPKPRKLPPTLPKKYPWEPWSPEDFSQRRYYANTQPEPEHKYTKTVLKKSFETEPRKYNCSIM